MRTPSADFILRIACAKYLKDSKPQKLKICLQAGAIDAFFTGRYSQSAVTEAAKIGDKEAVTFLLSQGAQIKYAILGTAEKGEKACLNQLLRQFPHLLPFAVEGAATGNHRQLAQSLIADDISLYDHLIAGAARGEHWDWVDEQLGSKPSPEQATIAAFGAALNQNWKRMNKYQSLGGNLHKIAEGIGITGHWAQGKKLLDENPQYPELKNFLALGFAIGGHEQKAHRLCRKPHLASLSRVYYGAAFSGNTRWCLQLLRHSLAYANFALIGASAGGHHHLSESLRNKLEALYDIPNVDCIDKMAEAAKANGFKAYAEQLKKAAPNAFQETQMPLTQHKKTENQTITPPKSPLSLNSSYASTFTLSESSFHLEDKCISSPTSP